jgi:hypothetical protein
MKRRLGAWLVGWACWIASSFGLGGADYSREIEPILSDKCYHCHGPSETGRKASLRFDNREGAFRIKDGKTVIVPGKSAESELVKRITSTDRDYMMPPPESNRTLTPQQIKLLREWVDEGAKWGLHWSFVAPQAVAIPRPGKHRVSHPIDAFIAERLETEALKMSPEADRERLLRRVSFDLTGLPPTLAEIDAFKRDKAPGAYERVVDRLLSSPQFGERMATEWLDLARYADTHGYQMDRYRPMWPYRDWVINAFNQNLPFDKFVTWQLAGDLIPNATKEQRLATAFNRLHLQNEEGGIVEEEFRVSYIVDRVNTFGTAFLGLTFECCRCHDHKYDPISQRDFYQMFSFFQNIDESGQTIYFGDVMPVPTLLLTTEPQDQQLAAARQKSREAEQRWSQEIAQSRPRFDEWLNQRTNVLTIPGLIARFTFNESAGGKITNSVGTNTASLVEDPKFVEGKFGKAISLSGDNGVTMPGVGNFTRADPFSIGLWIKASSLPPRTVILHHSRAWMDAGSRGYEILLENGHIAVGLHHMWPGSSIKVVTTRTLPTNTWVHVAFTYDGSSKAKGLVTYIDGQIAAVETIRDALTQDFTYGGSEPDLAIGYRFRDIGFKGGAVDDLRVYNRALTPGEIGVLAGLPALKDAFAKPANELTESDRALLETWYQSTTDTEILARQDELTQLRREENKLVSGVPDIMVMQEMKKPKPAYVLKRGAYDSPGAEVFADTPKVLPPFPSDQPKNRLGLARWLMEPQNPLTARVTVNRFWQMFFGKGIVETADNFGLQGSQPSHLDLLDWLAVAFSQGSSAINPKHGGPMQPWDVKALCRLIVTSAAYKQSSRATPETLARDPDNRLLARGPAKRLTAEMLRDQALSAGGLLVEKVGGPSVKPYQPDGLWEVAMGNPRYEQGHGDDLHRRSLYTFWKRTVPPPAMVTFDAAERNTCVVRRQSTSTPLQALTLLNDVQITEAARFVAARTLKEAKPGAANRAQYAFRLITDRTPTGRETKILTQLLEEQTNIFARDPAAIKKLLADGETASDPALPPADLAAGTVLAEAIFNHDEAVMRR